MHSCLLSPQSVGTHYVVNFYQCNISQLALSPENFEKIMIKISKKIFDEQLTVLHHYFHFFGKNAVTGFFLLAESHIAFHTWPESNFVTCDIFVCNHTKNNEKHAENILHFLGEKIFLARKSEIKTIKR